MRTRRIPVSLSEFCRRKEITLPEAILATALTLNLVTILAAMALGRLPQGKSMLALNAGAIVVVLIVRPFLVAAPPRTALRFVRSWYPVPFFPFIFMQTGKTVPALNPHDADSALIAADRAIFGTDPTVWLQGWHHPVLTEFLQLCYFSFYLLPIIMGCQWWFRKGEKAYLIPMTGLSLGFYLSYIGFFFAPAVGPRFTIQHDFALDGVLTYRFIHSFLLATEGIMHDCFPSGHTLVTVLTLWYAWKIHRPTFWGILPFASGLIFSTVYLRYHYVVDVFAAVPLAVMIVAITPVLLRAWDNLVTPASAPDPSIRS